MKKLVLLCFVLVYQVSFGQECLDVKYKLRGYFYAGTSVKDTSAFGGFYEDKNIPKKLSDKIADISASNQFQIIAKTNESSDYAKDVSGFKVYVVNQSDSLVKLPAQDSRLYLTRQVFYKNEWRDIEYLPSSWCGNSYHQVFIKPNEFWEFTAPCLSGKIEAKCRFELYINENLSLYSNEFNGSFNKKQLTKEQGYQNSGIMDPYDN